MKMDTSCLVNNSKAKHPCISAGMWRHLDTVCEVNQLLLTSSSLLHLLEVLDSISVSGVETEPSAKRNWSVENVPVMLIIMINLRGAYIPSEHLPYRGATKRE